MVKIERQSGRLVLLLCFFIFFNSGNLNATILVYDLITSKAEPVQLTAAVKGLFTPKGGIRVQFFIDTQKVCNTLTGFDGFAFCQYTPFRKGVHLIVVKTSTEQGKGHLYVLSPKERVFFIQMQALLNRPFPFVMSEDYLQDTEKAISKISKIMPVVYLDSSVGFRNMKRVIDRFHLPKAPLIEYYEGLFEELKKRKINLYGILCSGSLCDYARDYFKKTFCFEEREGVFHIEDWHELLNKLKIRSR